MFKNWAVLFLVWIAFACNRGSEIIGDPKHRLSEYVSRSFMVKQVEDKTQLMSYLTGDVKQRLESWSPDQFKEAFLSTKRELIKFSVRELKMISEDEVQITYEIVYNEQKKMVEGQASEAKITNKKLCQMTRGEHGNWFISDVKNIKELIEFKDEMSLP